MLTDAHPASSNSAGHNSDVIRPSLNFGMLTGGLGTIFGSFLGIIRSRHPVIFTLASGLQWFTVGTIYWASRTMMINAQSNWFEDVRRASGFAAAIAGGSAGAIARGRRNILPGALVFGTLGFSAQHVCNVIGKSDAISAYSTRQVFDKMTRDRSWFPFQALDDYRYREMLQEKLVRLESEIAILEEDIRNLQATSKK